MSDGCTSRLGWHGYDIYRCTLWRRGGRSRHSGSTGRSACPSPCRVSFYDAKLHNFNELAKFFCNYFYTSVKGGVGLLPGAEKSHGRHPATTSASPRWGTWAWCTNSVSFLPTLACRFPRACRWCSAQQTQACFSEFYCSLQSIFVITNSASIIQLCIYHVLFELRQSPKLNGCCKITTARKTSQYGFHHKLTNKYD